MKHGLLARGWTSGTRTETPLYAFSRAIDRESLAGLGNSLRPPPLVLLLLLLLPLLLLLLLLRTAISQDFPRAGRACQDVKDSSESSSQRLEAQLTAALKVGPAPGRPRPTKENKETNPMNVLKN